MTLNRRAFVGRLFGVSVLAQDPPLAVPMNPDVIVVNAVLDVHTLEAQIPEVVARVLTSAVLPRC